MKHCKQKEDVHDVPTSSLMGDLVSFRASASSLARLSLNLAKFGLGIYGIISR
jgi:hypothetical protein